MNIQLPYHSIHEYRQHNFKSASDSLTYSGKFPLGRSNYINNLTEFSTGNFKDRTWAPNPFIHAKIGSKKLLVVVGESWTYSDSLSPLISASEHWDNPLFRVASSFSSKLAHILNSDLLLFAVPGYSTFQIIRLLEDSLYYANKLNEYDEIACVVQMSSPGRDVFLDDTEIVPEVSNFLNSDTPVYNWKEWHTKLDELYLNGIDGILKKYKITNSVVWRNFNEFLYRDFDKFSFKVLPDPCMRYLCELSGLNITLADTLESEFFENIHLRKNLSVTTEELTENLDRAQKSLDVLAYSELNDWHMNHTGHYVWASRLLPYLV